MAIFLFTYLFIYFVSCHTDFAIELNIQKILFYFMVGLELYATKLKNWCHSISSADSCYNETGEKKND